MTAPGSRAQEELELAKDFYDRGLDLLVELLAVRSNANKGRESLTDELLRYLDPFGIWRRYLQSIGTADIRNVIFDLTRLHVDTLQDFTKISQRHTEYVAKRLDALRTKREAGARPGAEHPRQVVRVLQWDAGRNAYHATFSIGDGMTREETVRFPEAIVVRPSDGSGEFPITVRFEPETLTLRPGHPEAVSVLVPGDEWLQRGVRYQGMLLLGTASGAPVQLFLRLAPG